MRVRVLWAAPAERVFTSGRVFLVPDEMPAARAQHLLTAGDAEIVEEGVSDPLDHDLDGKKGGSLKGSDSTATKGARRRKTRS